MGADSNGSQAKGGASGKGGSEADSKGARKKTSAPSVHDARKVSCPLILLGSVSAQAPDFLHLNQASGRSDRSAIGPPTRARVIVQLLRRAVRWRGPFSELRFGEHPRACGNKSWTLLPRMRRNGCRRLKSAMLLAPSAQVRDASLRHSITSLQENIAQ